MISSYKDKSIKEGTGRGLYYFLYILNTVQKHFNNIGLSTIKLLHMPLYQSALFDLKTLERQVVSQRMLYILVSNLICNTLFH